MNGAKGEDGTLIGGRTFKVVTHTFGPGEKARGYVEYNIVLANTL